MMNKIQHERLTALLDKSKPSTFKKDYLMKKHDSEVMETRDKLREMIGDENE